MRTTLDCLVCFMRQARSAGLLTCDDPLVQRQMLAAAGQFIADVDTDRSPPENAVALYARFAELLGVDDPYAQLKQESNEFALSIREDIRQRIAQAADPLLAAIRVAVGGNIIDHGALHSFDAAKTIEECFTRDFVVDDYPALADVLQEPGAEVLYLCDNCGEIVFDTLLIEQLVAHGCRVTAVVRDEPIINDATLEDARRCGLDRMCSVMSSGSPCPGTPLGQCTLDFLARFRSADLIISKGMGNFETLSEEHAPIYFLFTVKCSQVALHLTEHQGLPAGLVEGKGEMVLLRQSRDL